ncbi:MAG: hypothetical protein L0Y72_08080 [Gemmataceae bacterium]|nr:hypothetical protein [Gemmataceae bacterium]MCI0738986.1 hypothetical protein [Gemmataceae bacterium]
MATAPSGLRGLFLLGTLAIYVLSFFLPAWHDSRPVPGYEAFTMGLFYFIFVPFSIPWFANPLFAAAWICLFCKSYAAAKMLGIMASVFAASFLLIWQPWQRGGNLDWGYMFWCIAMVSVAASAHCLQFLSSHYEELGRRALIAQQLRWLSKLETKPCPAPKREMSTAIQEMD